MVPEFVTMDCKITHVLQVPNTQPYHSLELDGLGFYMSSSLITDKTTLVWPSIQSVGSLVLCIFLYSVWSVFYLYPPWKFFKGKHTVSDFQRTLYHKPPYQFSNSYILILDIFQIWITWCLLIFKIWFYMIFASYFDYLAIGITSFKIS